MPRMTPLVLALTLAACGPDYSPNVYSGSAVQQAAKVEQGIVVGLRQVGVAAQGTTGTVTGAAAGGALGSQLPAGGDVASTLGAIGGSLIGGIVGKGVERSVGEKDAFEYIVRKASGELVSVTQRDEIPLAIGERVLVIAGSQARVVPDYTVQLAPQGAPASVAPPAAERTPAVQPVDAAPPVALAPPTGPQAPLAEPKASPVLQETLPPSTPAAPPTD